MRQGPILRRVYDQMAEPKWVMSFGACASTGGFYDNYATMPGIDRIIPVDVYVPGCPPRPEAVLDALMALQRKIQSQKQKLDGEVTSSLSLGHGDRSHDRKDTPAPRGGAEPPAAGGLRR